MSVLLAYDAQGRRDEGWPIFLQVSDPVNWAGEAQPGLIALMLRIREHFDYLIKQGELFAPWPPEVPVLSSPSNPRRDHHSCAREQSDSCTRRNPRRNLHSHSMTLWSPRW